MYLRNSGKPQMQVVRYFQPSNRVTLPSPLQDPNRYEKEMQDVNSHGHKAMKILEQTLADAEAEAENQKLATNAQNADNTGKQHTNLPHHAMPVMSSNSVAVQAPAPVNNNIAGPSGYMTPQYVQHDASVHIPNGVNGNNGVNNPNGVSIPNVVNGANSGNGADSGNGMYEAGPASQQQQGERNNTMLSAHTGALTIASSPFNDDNVARRDIFSNDHLTSEIVPLEDPAEVAALNQSTVPLAVRIGRSKQLNLLTCGPNQRPNAAYGLSDENFPFAEGARLSGPTPAYGVIRLYDIPESTRRSEILAVMGRNSRVLNDNQEPVHIVMERVNAATREAYVEFMDENAAINAIQRFDRAQRDGRTPRLGEHPLRYELSSQAALMKALFPQAKGVQWQGAVPHILPDDHTEWGWERFKGFISREEMFCLAKHGETNKSYTCPQRPYEVMISTLRKMPFYMTQHITFEQRYAMYDAAERLIHSLRKQIRFKNSPYILNEQLLERLWVSAMLCPGFTVTQKDNIAFIVGLSEERMRDFNMPRFADGWKHTYSLVPKPGVIQDVLEWYIAIIRETTTDEIMRMPPQPRQEILRMMGDESFYWGYYWKILRLEDFTRAQLNDMTLAQLAEREFYCVSGILNLAFGGYHPGLNYDYNPFVPNHQAGSNQQQQNNNGAAGPDHQAGIVQQQELVDPFQQQPANGGQQFSQGVQGVDGGQVVHGNQGGHGGQGGQ